jgi:hypothetical protein
VKHLYGRASSKWVQLDRAIELSYMSVVVGKLVDKLEWRFSRL